MQPREWLVLVLLIAIPLAIAVVVTLWSIKQMAYAPKKQVRPKPALSAEDFTKIASDVGEERGELLAGRQPSEKHGERRTTGVGARTGSDGAAESPNGRAAPSRPGTGSV